MMCVRLAVASVCYRLVLNLRLLASPLDCEL